MLIPCRYDMAYTFKDSLAVVKMNGLFGYINKAGEQIIPVSLMMPLIFMMISPLYKKTVYGDILISRETW